MAAARAFAELGKEQSKKFRFVFLSGIVAVRDQNSTVLMFGDARKIAVRSPSPFLPSFVSRAPFELIEAMASI
jgi:hypothetical protein